MKCRLEKRNVDDCSASTSERLNDQYKDFKANLDGYLRGVLAELNRIDNVPINRINPRTPRCVVRCPGFDAKKGSEEVQENHHFSDLRNKELEVLKWRNNALSAVNES